MRPLWLETALAMLVATVLAKSASSPIDAASSLRVSRALGARSMTLATALSMSA